MRSPLALLLSLQGRTLSSACCRALDLGRSEAEQAGPAVSHRSPLTWTARLHVAADAASALAYVHQVCGGLTQVKGAQEQDSQ